MTIIAVPTSQRVLLQRAHFLAQHPDRWPVRPRFEPTRRWYARIAADDAEGWLLTWLPGQRTDWHDHGDSAGAFVVVSGCITEEVAGSPRDEPARELTVAGRREFAAGTGRTFGVRHVHRVTNHGVEPAVTLHVYAPALRTMTRYAVVGGALQATGVQRAGSDW